MADDIRDHLWNHVRRDPPSEITVQIPNYWVLIRDNLHVKTRQLYEAFLTFDSSKSLEKILIEFGTQLDYYDYKTKTDKVFGTFHVFYFAHNMSSQPQYGLITFYTDENNNKCAVVSISDQDIYSSAY